MISQQHSVLNIAHSLINKQINALYHYHSSLFDILFKELSINIFNYDGIHSYYYDLFISNNFLTHHNTTRQYSQQNHIKDLLLFHSPPPPTFKKEDIQLVQQNTNRTHCILFGNYLANSWKRLPNKYTEIIDYGIPDLSSSVSRTKSILLFNLDNNPNVGLLHQHINKHIGNCDMLQDIPGNVSIQEIYDLLSQYQVCIDTSSIINGLLAIGCGCYCISPMPSDNHPLLIHINDYNDIITIIRKLLSDNLAEDQRKDYSNQIRQKYSFLTFTDKIMHKIDYIKHKEIFWL